MINISCLPKIVREAACGGEDDTVSIAGVQVYDDFTGAKRILYAPVYAEFTDTSARLFDAFGNSVVLTYSAIDKTREQLEDLIETCGCCGGGEVDYLEVITTSIPTVPTVTGNTSNLNSIVTDVNGDIWAIDIYGNGKKLNAPTIGSGTVTSVGASATGALSFTGSPITTSGTLVLGWTGTSSQMVLGNGTLAALPNLSLYVPTSRALTINGITQDLSANRTFGGYVALNDTAAGYSVELSSGDLNNYTKSQSIYSNGNVTNNPTSNSNSYHVLIQGVTNQYSSQLAIRAANTTVDGFFWRVSNAGTWGAWFQVASRQWVTAQGYTTNTGTVTSVGASIDGDSVSISGSPITTSGTLAFTWTGNNTQYVRGDGVLETFPSIPSITPSALTKTDDTNVTLTLGGTPSTALLQAVSLTLGWTGVLAIARGGTGLSSLGTAGQLLQVNASATALEYFTPTWTSNAGTVTSVGASATGALSFTGSPITTSGTLVLGWTGTNAQMVLGDGTLTALPTIPVITPAALTRTNDTNVILTLTGTPSTALLESVNIAVGWFGTLSTNRGGTGISGVGTAGQMLRVNSAGNALEYFTPSSSAVDWSDTMIAFGHTSQGGLYYSTGLTYHYSQAAFSVGTRAAGTVGTGSVQLGGNSVLSGSYAVGLGYQNTVTANYSTVSGYNNTVTSQFCFVSGNTNTQSGTGGIGSFISGAGNTQTGGSYLFCSGYQNASSGSYSFTAGTDLTNSGVYATIIGRAGSVTHNGTMLLLDGAGPATSSTATNMLVTRFAGGYSFLAGSTQLLGINSSGVITAATLAGVGTRMVVASSTGVLSTQTIPTGANSVWYVQGTATDATTNAQDIVRTGRVRIGAAGTSSYMLNVLGTSSFTQNIDLNNNTPLNGFTTGAVAVNLIRMSSANQIQIGQASYSIILPGYLSTREDTSSFMNLLGTTTTGVLQSYPSYIAVNNHASKYRGTTQNISADGTWYNQVITSSVTVGVDSPYTFNGANVDIRPTQTGFSLVSYYIEYTNQGGVITDHGVSVRLKYNGVVISNSESYIKVSCTRNAISRTTLFSHTVANQNLTIEVKVDGGANGITIQRAEIITRYAGRVGS